MKKNIVLFVLFILPIVAYLFFASGVNSFTKLPIITNKVSDFGTWNSLKGDQVSLTGKITVLGFLGDNVLAQRGNLFNLNQKIYQRYYEFKDLQFVMVCQKGTERQVQAIVDALKASTNVKSWHFVFATPAEIKSFYNQLQLQGQLDAKNSTSYVFLVDKEKNIRGRKDAKEYKEGYDTFHPSDLSNAMMDDFKILLYEYKAALKKNNNASKKL